MTTSTRPSTVSRVILQGKGPVTINPSDHIATGGEGSIYRVGDLAVKIYLDPNKMRAAGIPEKVRTLSALNHPYIAAPKGLVIPQSGTHVHSRVSPGSSNGSVAASISDADAIGIYLPFVTGDSLSTIVTNSYWKQTGFDRGSANILASRMREAVIYAHDQHAVLVDGNELNWQVDTATTPHAPIPHAIDVDSWAIGRWPAQVVMPSIRDWSRNSTTFDNESDWFAWAVVTFQVYTSIHPYKGTLAGFKQGDLIGRMKSNASVFSPGISLPHVVRDFNLIPTHLRDWYEATFVKKQRTAPPDPLAPSIAAAMPAARTLHATTQPSGDVLIVEKIQTSIGDPIIQVFPCGVVLTTKGKLIDVATKRIIRVHDSTAGKCAVIKIDRGWIYANRREVVFVDDVSLAAETLDFQLARHDVFVNGEGTRIFSIVDKGLSEINITRLGDRVFATASEPWGVLVNSTKWFSGVGVLDGLGTIWAVIPFGTTSCTQTRVPELDGKRVISGKASSRFASFIVVDKNGDYQKLELSFSMDQQTYTAWTGPTDLAELNLAILPNGVCATIVRDGELDIFVPVNSKTNRVVDKIVSTDMALSTMGSNVVAVWDGDLWIIKLK